MPEMAINVSAAVTLASFLANELLAGDSSLENLPVHCLESTNNQLQYCCMKRAITPRSFETTPRFVLAWATNDVFFPPLLSFLFPSSLFPVDQAT